MFASRYLMRPPVFDDGIVSDDDGTVSDDDGTVDSWPAPVVDDGTVWEEDDGTVDSIPPAALFQHLAE